MKSYCLLNKGTKAEEGERERERARKEGIHRNENYASRKRKNNYVGLT